MPRTYFYSLHWFDWMLINLIVRKKRVCWFCVAELFCFTISCHVQKEQLQTRPDQGWSLTSSAAGNRDQGWLERFLTLLAGNWIQIKLSLEGQDHLSLQSQSASYWKPFRTLQCTRPWCIYVYMPAVADQYQYQTSTRPWDIYVLMPATVPDLQYQTMMPSKSCSTTPSARVLMSSPEADPLEPTKMLERGTFTWLLVEWMLNKNSYPDWKTFPLWCCFSIILHIIQGLERAW